MRVFVGQDLVGDHVMLGSAETHYVAHVLRLRRGDRLVLFNGNGSERHAVITELRRQEATLSLGASVRPLPASPLELRLLQGLPKAEAMDWIVQKATELGVAALEPVLTQFSVVRLDDQRTARRLEHWRRVSEHACEQCGRHTPLRIRAPRELSAALDEAPRSGLRLALDFEAETDLVAIEQAPGPVWLACGPEGGFGPEDRRLLAAAGFVRTALGPRVLRTETATVAASALLQARWGDLSSPAI